MRCDRLASRTWKRSWLALVAGVVCLSMVEEPLLAAGMAAGSKAEKDAPVMKQIQGEDRVLHALNRFTFGPRPGDGAAVPGTGVQRWVEMGVDPASLRAS